MNDYNTVLKEYLNKIGVEYSKEIKLITNTVFDIHAHFMLDDLLNKIKSKNISRELIEKIIGYLIASGLIRKIYFQDKIYFEQIYGHVHHDHLICIKCNKIVPFRDELIEKEQQRIVDEKGFELLKHTLMIIGICPECLSKKEVLEEYEFQKEDKGLGKEKILPLSMVLSGEKVTIVEFSGGKHFSQRLICMGLNIGESIEVISNDFHGPFLIKVKNTRLGLGHGMTHKILVKR